MGRTDKQWHEHPLKEQLQQGADLRRDRRHSDDEPTLYMPDTCCICGTDTAKQGKYLSDVWREVREVDGEPSLLELKKNGMRITEECLHPSFQGRPRKGRSKLALYCHTSCRLVAERRMEQRIRDVIGPVDTALAEQLISPPGTAQGHAAQRTPHAPTGQAAAAGAPGMSPTERALHSMHPAQRARYAELLNNDHATRGGCEEAKLCLRDLLRKLGMAKTGLDAECEARKSAESQLHATAQQRDEAAEQLAEAARQLDASRAEAERIRHDIHRFLQGKEGHQLPAGREAQALKNAKQRLEQRASARDANAARACAHASELQELRKRVATIERVYGKDWHAALERDLRSMAEKRAATDREAAEVSVTMQAAFGGGLTAKESSKLQRSHERLQATLDQEVSYGAWLMERLLTLEEAYAQGAVLDDIPDDPAYAPDDEPDAAPGPQAGASLPPLQLWRDGHRYCPQKMQGLAMMVCDYQLAGHKIQGLLYTALSLFTGVSVGELEQLISLPSWSTTHRAIHATSYLRSGQLGGMLSSKHAWCLELDEGPWLRRKWQVLLVTVEGLGRFFAEAPVVHSTAAEATIPYVKDMAKRLGLDLMRLLYVTSDAASSNKLLVSLLDALKKEDAAQRVLAGLAVRPPAQMLPPDVADNYILLPSAVPATPAAPQQPPPPAGGAQTHGSPPMPAGGAQTQGSPPMPAGGAQTQGSPPTPDQASPLRPQEGEAQYAVPVKVFWSRDTQHVGKNAEIAAMNTAFGAGVHPTTGKLFHDFTAAFLFQFARLMAYERFAIIIKDCCPAIHAAFTVPGEVKHRLMIKGDLAIKILVNKPAITHGLQQVNQGPGDGKWSPASTGLMDLAHEVWLAIQHPVFDFYAAVLRKVQPVHAYVYSSFQEDGGFLMSSAGARAGCLLQHLSNMIDHADEIFAPELSRLDESLANPSSLALMRLTDLRALKLLHAQPARTRGADVAAAGTAPPDAGEDAAAVAGAGGGAPPPCCAVLLTYEARKAFPPAVKKPGRKPAAGADGGREPGDDIDEQEDAMLAQADAELEEAMQGEAVAWHADGEGEVLPGMTAEGDTVDDDTEEPAEEPDADTEPAPSEDAAVDATTALLRKVQDLRSMSSSIKEERMEEFSGLFEPTEYCRSMRLDPALITTPHPGGELSVAELRCTLRQNMIRYLEELRAQYSKNLQHLQGRLFRTASYWSAGGFERFSHDMHETSVACERPCPAGCQLCAANSAAAGGSAAPMPFPCLDRAQYLEQYADALGLFDYAAHAQPLQAALASGSVRAVQEDDPEPGYGNYTLHPVLDRFARMHFIASVHSMATERAVGKIHRVVTRQKSYVSSQRLNMDMQGSKDMPLQLVASTPAYTAALAASQAVLRDQHAAVGRECIDALRRDVEVSTAKRAAQAATREAAALDKRRLEERKQKSRALTERRRLVNSLRYVEYMRAACELIGIPDAQAKARGELLAWLLEAPLPALQLHVPSLAQLAQAKAAADKQKKGAARQARALAADNAPRALFAQGGDDDDAMDGEASGAEPVRAAATGPSAAQDAVEVPTQEPAEEPAPAATHAVAGRKRGSRAPSAPRGGGPSAARARCEGGSDDDEEYMPITKRGRR